MAGEKTNVRSSTPYMILRLVNNVTQKLKKSKTVYVSLPASRRARSGGKVKTDERVKASADKTMRKALAAGRGTVKLGPNTQVYVGGVRRSTSQPHTTRSDRSLRFV